MNYEELLKIPEPERHVRALPDEYQVSMAKLALRGWQFKHYSRAGASETAMWFVTTPPGISGYGFTKTAHISLMGAITAARMAEMTREANTSE